MSLEEEADACKAKWQQIKKIQDKLQAMGSKPLAHDDPFLQVLHEKEKRLKAQVQIIEGEVLARIPQNKEMQLLLSQRENDKEREDYREMLGYLRSNRADTLNLLKEAEDEEVGLKRLNENLKEKLAATKQDLSSQKSASLDTVLADLQSEVDKVSQTYNYFHQTLKQILASRCPRPDTAQVQQTLNESQDVDAEHVWDLKRMVGKLLEQTLNNPGQPYIQLDHRAWPAQVETLLRCQVAVKHPEDPTKIKLVPFHL